MTKREAAATATAPAPAGVTPERVAPEKVAGVYMNDKHQYWLNGDGPVPSVTTILGIMDKPAVGVFKAKEAARAIYRRFSAARLAVGPEDEAIKWALSEADKVRDLAASFGSSVHLLADLVGNAPQGQESDPTGFGVDESTYPYIEAYRGFLGRYSASAIVSSEKAVWSLKGYAGTYDLLMMIEDDLWLIDIKTSGKGPYPEWGLQLAGYRWADYIVLPGSPELFPMPQIQRAGVLHLRPDLYLDTGWRLIEYPITYALDYRSFLSALDLWRWRDSKRFTKSKLLKP
jgi:hypothetical protein